MRGRALLLILAFTAGRRLPASEIQTWHGVNAELFQRAAWTLSVRGDVRWTGGFGELIQYRGGPEVRWSPNGRYTLIGLFQGIEGKGEFERFDESNRFFGGFEWALPTGKRGILYSRSAVERFIGANHGPYNRYRQFERVRWAFPLRPSAGCEVLSDRAGLLTVRPQGSISLPLQEVGAIEISYIHDRRRQDAGGLRHVIRTELRIHKR